VDKDRLNIISQNFNGYSGEKNTKTLTSYLKRYKDKVDIIAGQELPARINEKKVMEDNSLDGSFDGEAEGNSKFFTGFYIINKDYEDGLICHKEISKIWNDLVKYPSIVPTFRSAYWCEKWIEFGGEKIKIINIHVSPTYEIMLKLSLMEYIEKINNKYTILLGDFNAAEKRDTVKHICENDNFLKLIRNKEFEELRSEKEKNDNKGHYTHYTKKGGRKLDHVFVSKKFYDEFNYEIDYIDEVNYTHPEYISSEFAFTDHLGIKVSFSKKIKSNL
jgi:endonuclease/exonuclease/phosphatase family metal-dependent hydrolase